MNAILPRLSSAWVKSETVNTKLFSWTVPLIAAMADPLQCPSMSRMLTLETGRWLCSVSRGVSSVRTWIRGDEETDRRGCGLWNSHAQDDLRTKTERRESCFACMFDALHICYIIFVSMLLSLFIQLRYRREVFVMNILHQFLYSF